MDTLFVQRCFVKIFAGNASYACIAANQLDEIDKIKTYPLALCVNDQPLPMKGRHWIGLYIQSKNSPLEVFCSYGKPVETYGHHFVNFIARHRLRVIQKFRTLQSPLTSLCGWYVIYYMLQRYMKRSREIIYSKFSKNVFQNDSFIVNFSQRFKQINNFKY